MNRRTFLPLVGAAASSRVFSAPPSRPPNFVIALCDDLGFGDLQCFGHPTIQTPNLDRFAAQGTRFTGFYAAAPVCSPSRAGLLTGRTPDRCGIYDWIPPGNPMHLRREEITWASLLRAHGYSTCLSGKWHLNGFFNSPQQPQPGDHGFTHWFATQNNAAPTHHNPTNFVRNGQPVGPLRGYSSTVIIDEALRWLETVDSQSPFALHVCFHSPHEPIATAEEFTGRYPLADPRNRAIYYGNVTQMDFEFGRLMAALQRRGNLENTFILFTSDNGPETLLRYLGAARSYGSAAPFRSMKLSLYEGGYRVPGILQWPRYLKPGRTESMPACALDLLPTFCDLAGIPIPQNRHLDGSSLLPWIRGKSMQRARPLHWHYFNAIDAPRASLRDGDWKIVGCATGPARRPGGGFTPADMPLIQDASLSRFELYNLRADPGEKNDLSAREPRRFAALRRQLEAIHAEVRAAAPVWN
jgi:arylsulfatase A